MVLVIVLMHLLSELVLNELCTIDPDFIFRGRNFFYLFKKKKNYRLDGVNSRPDGAASFYFPITHFFLSFFFSLFSFSEASSLFFFLSSQIFFWFRDSLFSQFSSIFST
jgi:hypothetical protein